MTVTTKAYGPVEAEEKQKIHFPRGLLGFEQHKDYVLLNAHQEPFYYLQCLDSVEVAFVLIDPFLFRPDYEMDIGDEELAAVGITDQKESIVLSIVTIPQTAGPMTANLMGPIIINKSNRQALQAILADPRYNTKHDIVRELAEARKA